MGENIYNIEISRDFLERMQNVLTTKVKKKNQVRHYIKINNLCSLKAQEMKSK